MAGDRSVGRVKQSSGNYATALLCEWDASQRSDLEACVDWILARSD